MYAYTHTRVNCVDPHIDTYIPMYLHSLMSTVIYMYKYTHISNCIIYYTKGP